MLEPLLTQLNEMRIVLASSSKQRAALLASTKGNDSKHGMKGVVYKRLETLPQSPDMNPIENLREELRNYLSRCNITRTITSIETTTLKFEICPSNFEENLDPIQHSCSDFVEKTALGKLNDVYERLKNDEMKPDIIIGVDTMVFCNGRMYGKPKTKEEAIRTITDLTQSGIPNSVYSGVVIRHKDKIRKFTEVTTVHMYPLDDQEILSYVETGEPMGKAGGYGIQGIASTFVTRIEGDGNNVIGLPLCRLVQELKSLLKQPQLKST